MHDEKESTPSHGAADRHNQPCVNARLEQAERPERSPATKPPSTSAVEPPILVFGFGDGAILHAVLDESSSRHQHVVLCVPESERAAFERLSDDKLATLRASGKLRVAIGVPPVTALEAAFPEWAPARLRGVRFVLGDAAMDVELRRTSVNALRDRHANETAALEGLLSTFRASSRRTDGWPRSVFGAADCSTSALQYLGMELVQAIQRMGVAGRFLVTNFADDPFRPIRRLESLLSAQPDLLLSLVASRDRDWGRIAEGIPTLSYWSSDPSRYDLAAQRFSAGDLVCVSDAAWIEHFRRLDVEAHHLPLASGLGDSLPNASDSLIPSPTRPVLLVGHLPAAGDVLPRDLAWLAAPIDAAALRATQDAAWTPLIAAHELCASHRIPERQRPAVERAIEFAWTRHERLAIAHALADAAIPFIIHGSDRWRDALSGSRAAAFWAGPLVGRQETANAFRQAAAVINVTSRNGRDGVNMRVFDVASCGGLLVSNDSTGLRSAFAVNDEVLAFRSPDEVPEILRVALSDPDRAARMRSAARARCRRDHSWDARWRLVLRWFAERRQRAPAVEATRRVA